MRLLPQHCLGPSASAQMLGPHQELTYTLGPFLDSDSAAELRPGPEQFAVLLWDLKDELTQHQGLPEVVLVVSWDQNQVPGLPP